jgi:hypothetical protein
MLAMFMVVAAAIAIAIMVPSVAFVESISIVVASMPIRAVSVVIISIVETVAVVVAAWSIVAVIPGTSADEHTVHKPVRSVVAVRSAGVRIIAVITVSTDRGWSTNANVDYNSLCMSIGSEKQTNA